MLNKRVYSTSKSSNSNRYHGKSKESSSKSSSLKHKSSYDVHVAEADSTTFIFSPPKPDLPCYSSVLTRTSEDGVCMDDLDQLQQDLEKLLSNCAVRNRNIRSEIECIDRSEERREKKGRPCDKVSVKRKRPEEKSKHKEVKNGVKMIKPKHYSLPLNNFNEELPIKHEVPKITLPKNDTPNKFWLSIDPYCTDVSRDDIAFLDNLIAECNVQTELKIPDVGTHYATEWPNEMLNQEQSVASVGRTSRAKPIAHSIDNKKNALNAMVDTFNTPMTQRLLAALIEEKVMTKFPSNDKIKGDLAIRLTGPKLGLCMEQRLCKELIHQGLLDMEDLPKTMMPQDDDILAEIKKCHSELLQVNEHNVRELNKLRAIITKEQRRQEVKEALEKIDNQVMDLYNKILMSKQKPATSDDDDDEILPKQKALPRGFELEASSVIKQQIILHKEITELTDLNMLY